MKSRKDGKYVKPSETAPCSAGGGENGTPLVPQMSRYASSAINERPNVNNKLYTGSR